MKLLAYDPKKRKKVLCGFVKGDTFVRYVTSAHFHQLTQSYAIQEHIVQKLVEMDVKHVHLHTSVGYVLMSRLSDWLEPDIKVLDYGNGKQRFLPIKRMTRKPERDMGQKSPDADWQAELEAHKGEIEFSPKA
jgi:hypothetical protein